MNIIIKKWIEPYVILEELKENCSMIDFTFDGFNKNKIKTEFLSSINNSDNFGLYMKNVNKYYLFERRIDIKKLFNLSNEDYIETENMEKPFELVDLGKAEAAFINI